MIEITSELGKFLNRKLKFEQREKFWHVSGFAKDWETWFVSLCEKPEENILSIVSDDFEQTMHEQPKGLSEYLTVNLHHWKQFQNLSANLSSDEDSSSEEKQAIIDNLDTMELLDEITANFDFTLPNGPEKEEIDTSSKQAKKKSRSLSHTKNEIEVEITEDKTITLPTVRPLWVPDDRFAYCMLCKETFSLFRRRVRINFRSSSTTY
jgi:hypothetical protein